MSLAQPHRSSVRSVLWRTILLAIAAACGDGAVETPTAARIEAVAPVQQTAVVATAVPAAPRVKVVSADGAPVPGVAVNFNVVGGGSLAAATATTGPDGIATSGTWTLGTTSGAQSVVAGAAGLPTVVFAVTATAAAPASVTVSAGANQTALTGAMLPVAPSVTVRDAHGNGVPNTTVVFAVDAGGGSVNGASVTTGATGVATVGGWRLGVEPGAQRLRASAGALSATFDATANLPAGCAVAAYAIGATVTGAWTANDCVSAGGRDGQDPAGAVYDQYEVTLTAQQFFRTELTGPDARTFRIRRKGGDYVTLQSGTAFTSPTSNPMVVKYVLEPGTYIFETQAPASGTLGAYTLRTVADANITCRPIVFGTIGVTVSGTIDPATDCRSPGATEWYEDWLVMVLKTGDKLRLTMTTTDMAPFLVWRDDRLGPASPTLATKRSDTPGTIVIEWTATFDGFHEAVITRANATTPYGAYTLKVERVP